MITNMFGDQKSDCQKSHFDDQKFYSKNNDDQKNDDQRNMIRNKFNDKK